jgi:hypothetical protein
MTFIEETETDETNDEGGPDPVRSQLRQREKENRDLKAELAQANSDRLELAFLKAGIPDTPMASFFRDHYDGDTSPDAIRTAAADLGILASTSQETSDQIDAMEQMSQDAGGSQPPLPQDQAEEMDKALKAIRPGPRYSEEVELVLQRFGRPTRLDET